MSDYFKEAGNSHDGNRFVLGFWRDSGEFSVIADTWILDKRMLKNPEISDMIPRPQDNEQEPDEGWECIKGSVLKYSGKNFKFKVVI